jgi:hypothetical protein
LQAKFTSQSLLNPACALSGSRSTAADKKTLAAFTASAIKNKNKA